MIHTLPIRSLFSRLASVGVDQAAQVHAVIGHPGSGKTVFATELARRRPDVILSSCAPGLGRLQLLESFFECLGPHPKRRGDARSALSRVSQRVRARAVRVIVVDDAHRL